MEKAEAPEINRTAPLPKGLGLEPKLNPEKALDDNRLSDRDKSAERERDKLATKEDGKAALIALEKVETPKIRRAGPIGRGPKEEPRLAEAAAAPDRAGRGQAGGRCQDQEAVFGAEQNGEDGAEAAAVPVGAG